MPTIAMNHLDKEYKKMLIDPTEQLPQNIYMRVPAIVRDRISQESEDAGFSNRSAFLRHLLTKMCCNDEPLLEQVK